MEYPQPQDSGVEKLDYVELRELSEKVVRETYNKGKQLAAELKLDKEKTNRLNDLVFEAYFAGMRSARNYHVWAKAHPDEASSE